MAKVTCTIPLDSGFTHILFNLASQGYSHVYVEYHGGGDQGAIETIRPLKRGTVKESEEEFPKIIATEGLVVEDRDEFDSELKQVLEDKIYKDILDSASDWYNNEGGGGTLFISTEDYKYKCDHFYNVIHEEHEDINGTFRDN